jgi:hypothetical protein
MTFQKGAFTESWWGWTDRLLTVHAMLGRVSSFAREAAHGTLGLPAKKKAEPLSHGTGRCRFHAEPLLLGHILSQVNPISQQSTFPVLTTQ